MATIQTQKYMAIFVHIVTIYITTVTGVYNYAVQVEPVTFIEEPQSQLTTQGQSLVLSCQIRLTPPVSNQPIPSIDWLKDSLPITSEDHNITINTNVLVGFSELVIPVIDTSLSGSYQCIANDADKRYSTISKKAVITVLSKTNTTLIEAELGQPLLLNCSTVTVGYAATHIWLHNDTPVVDETILSSGSVFILNVNYNHQGIWQCHTSYSINIIPSDLTNNVPIAFLDADIRNISYNESLDVHCRLVGLPPDVIIDTVTWHQVSSSSNQTILLQLDEFDGSGFINDLDMVVFDYLIPKFEETSNGHYYCSVELITNNETVIIQSYGLDILITGSPIITTPKVVDIFLEYDAIHLELSCSYESDIPSSIYWTRNGKYIDVTNTYNMSSGLLRLSKPENTDNLFGIYQCFVENIHGTDYTVNRILVKYLSNPPGNLNIRALTNITNFFMPYLNISWTLPLQRGNVEELSYSIIVADTIDISNTSPVFINTDPSSAISSIVIELSMDSTYIVMMTANRPNIEGLSAKCLIDTTARFYTVNKPFDHLICTDDGRVLIKWTPLGSNPFLYPTEFVTINGACIHKGKVMEFHYLMTTLYDVYEAEPFSELLPGTVCEFYGQYRYGIIPLNVCSSNNELLDFVKLAQTYFEIPRKICQVQEDVLLTIEDSITLSLVCGNDQILISWNISTDILCKLNGSDANVLVSGVCVNEEEIFNFNDSIDLMRKPTGFLIYNNVTTNSICSIDVNISDVNYVISPGQCILHESSTHHTFKNDNSIQNQTIDCSSNRLTTPSYSTIHFLSETSTLLQRSSDILVIESDSGGPSGGPSYGIVGIIVAVCIVFLVAIAVFLAVLILFLYKQNIKTSWNVNEFEIHEKIESVTNEDVCSIKTVVDPLYQEEDTKLNVYKGYTIESTNSKPDTTGSSGYGSELMTVIGDYHSEKLNEVEDMNIQSEVESDISLLSNHFPGRTKDNVIMCVYCSTIQYKRTGSVNNLNRLCPCVGNEGYVRLAGINRAELVNHRDKMINSRERLNTRLSTLSV